MICYYNDYTHNCLNYCRSQRNSEKYFMMLSTSLMQTSPFLVFIQLAQLIEICGSPFKLILTPDGLPMCALNSPSYSMLACDILGIPEGVPDVLRCGYKCSTLGDTVCAAGFNYVDSGHCEFYATPPVNCSTHNKSCEYFEVRSILSTAMICC